MSTHGLGEAAFLEVLTQSDKVAHVRKIIIQGSALRHLIRDQEDRKEYCEEKEAFNFRKGALNNFRVLDAELMADTDDDILDDEIPRGFRDLLDPQLWRDDSLEPGEESEE